VDCGRRLCADDRSDWWIVHALRFLLADESSLLFSVDFDYAQTTVLIGGLFMLLASYLLNEISLLFLFFIFYCYYDQTVNVNKYALYR
jgi:hypothetical protein